MRRVRMEDDSLQTRLIAALAYTLPLLDAAERWGSQKIKG